MIVVVNCVLNKYLYALVLLQWNKDRWEVNGSTDPHLPNRFFIHPDSPAPGEKWMQYPISFHKLKLTNNMLNSNGLVSF